MMNSPVPIFTGAVNSYPIFACVYIVYQKSYEYSLIKCSNPADFKKCEKCRGTPYSGYREVYFWRCGCVHINIEK